MAYVFGEDITENLKSLSFEAGVSEDERYSTDVGCKAMLNIETKSQYLLLLF